jgi:hypothetical protein
MLMRRALLIGCALAFLAIAVVLRSGFFALAFYALLAIAGLAYLMTFSALDHIGTERHCTTRQAEIGGLATVTVAVTNRKALPIPWIVIEDIVPGGLDVTGINGRATVMAPGGHTRLRYDVKCNARGYHRIGPVLLESGDFFGLSKRVLSVTTPHYLTVYPRTVPIERYEIPTQRPLGELTMRRRLFEDPTRLAGVREYQHGDPLRRVHWKATAKTGKLHSRVYDPSSLLGGNIILDFNAPSWHVEDRDPRSEFAVVIAGSLVAYIAGRRQDIGFITNGIDAAEVMAADSVTEDVGSRAEARRLAAQRRAGDRLRPLQVPVRQCEEALPLIRESLAHVELSWGLSLADMIAQEYEAWPRDTATILIVPQMPVELLTQVVRLRNAGFSVIVVLVNSPEEYRGARAALEAENIGVLHLRTEADLSVIRL